MRKGKSCCSNTDVLSLLLVVNNLVVQGIAPRVGYVA